MASSNTAVGRTYPESSVQEPVQRGEGLPSRALPGLKVTNYVGHTPLPPDATTGVLHELREERQRQDNKWGEQDHSPEMWMTVIMEEVGEASQEVLKHHFTTWGTVRKHHRAKLREELIQLAAVTVAAIESIDRQYS